MPLKLSENDVEKQIVDFLRAHRWTVTRQQSGLFARPSGRVNGINARYDKGRIRIGIPGMCDWRAERPVPRGEWTAGGYVQAFEFEVKAPGKKLSLLQVVYIAIRREAGFVAERFDCFDHARAGGPGDFLGWYKVHFE